MIDFEQQTRYLHKILLYLVENKSMTFTVAAAELRKVFIENNHTEALPALSMTQAIEHGVTPLHVLVICEPQRMQIADDLMKNNIAAPTAIYGVSHTSQRVLNSLKTMNELKSFVSASNLIESSRHLHFTRITFSYANILEFYLVRSKLDVTTILEKLGEPDINTIYDIESAMRDTLPGLLDMAANMMHKYGMTFSETLTEIQAVLNGKKPAHKLTEKDFYVEQIKLLKLEPKQIELLFPSLEHAHILMDEYQRTHIQPAATTPVVLNAEQEALTLIGHLEFDAAQAKNILNELNAQEIADLHHAVYHAIPAYCRAVEWLLTMTDLDRAHTEIARLISSPKSSPRFAIAFEDNNYAENLLLAKLQPWHLEKLLSDKKIKEAFTRKYLYSNLQAERAARAAIFEEASAASINRFQTTRSEYYNNEIYKPLEMAFGFSTEQSVQIGNQLSEMEIATFPFVQQHDFVIFKKLLVHCLHIYNMELDEALNTLWRISTNRFNPDKNLALHTIASKVIIDEWYFNIMSEQIRHEITTEVAALFPHAASDTQKEWTATNELRQAIGKLENVNRAAKLKQAQTALVDHAGFDAETANEVINTALTEQELGLVPFVVKVKLPMIKELLKALIITDPSLNHYVDAETQMRIIINGKFDHFGQRLAYEAMVGDYHIAQWYLNLIPQAEKTKLFAEARTARSTFHEKLDKVLINLDTVVVHRNVRNLLSVPAFPDMTLLPLQPAALAPLPTHNYFHSNSMLSTTGLQAPAISAATNSTPTSGYNVLMGATGTLVLITGLVGYLLNHNPLSRSGISSRLFNFFKPVVSTALETRKTQQRLRI
jgi:hypothetical protein